MVRSARNWESEVKIKRYLTNSVKTRKKSELSSPFASPNLIMILIAQIYKVCLMK